MNTSPTTRVATAYIGLGANLGSPASTLRAALHALAAIPETEVCASSGFWCSAPVDSDGPMYTNAVAALATRLPPLALLEALQAIELSFGRTRPYRYAPRTLDLDLLLYGCDPEWLKMESPRLSLPHPRMWQRRFVLMPLQEIAPNLTLSVGDQALTWSKFWEIYGAQLADQVLAPIPTIDLKPTEQPERTPLDADVLLGSQAQ